MILVKSQNHIAKEVSCSNTELVCIGEMMYDGVGGQLLYLPHHGISLNWRASRRYNILSSSKCWLKYRNIVDSKPSFYNLNDYEAVEVDRPIDFEFSKFLYLKYRL